MLTWQLDKSSIRLKKIKLIQLHGYTLSFVDLHKSFILDLIFLPTTLSTHGMMTLRENIYSQLTHFKFIDPVLGLVKIIHFEIA